MTYVGDFALGATFDVKFCTVQATGAPFTLAGSPVISAYVDNDTTQITAGITISADFDSVTGLNNIRVVATGGNGYATAKNYQLVITTGTVNSVSVVGYVIASFSIENRSALRPTTAGVTLDVSAGGEAGIDWANVGSPTATRALTNTTVGIATALGSGAIQAATFGAGAIDAAALATDAANEIRDAVMNAIIEGTITHKQILQIMGAVLAGKVSGAATATITFRNMSDTANAVVGTDDADGNRTAVTYTYT